MGATVTVISSPGKGWRSAGTTVAPTVLILGGFLASPPVYRDLRRRLLERAAAHVVIGNIWTPDWILAARRGLGPIVTRSGRALLRAGEISRGSAFSLGAPVLIVGHSAGGMSARVLTSQVPFEGRRLGAAGRIGAIVTLGTPHHVVSIGRPGSDASAVISAFADEHVPGAFFAPGIGYVSVASRAIVGRPDGSRQDRTALRFYRDLLPEPEVGEIEGDGLIPLRSALLEGSRRVVFDDVVHAPGARRPWYGSDDAIDRWWPVALEAWHAALEHRRATT
jgi:hypothetical protein